MVVAVLADEPAKKEIIARGFSPEVEFAWADSIRSLTVIDADVYFDFLFTFDAERILQLKRLLPRVIFVNSVVNTCNEIGEGIGRINGWPTMIGRKVAEIAFTSGEEKIADRFEKMNWPYTRSPDITGMITPRIVSMIVNEAFFAVGENVSTRNEIDTAMKLGTNYPYGPFEWANKIGLNNIGELLSELSKTDERYTPAPMLKLS